MDESKDITYEKVIKWDVTTLAPREKFLSVQVLPQQTRTKINICIYRKELEAGQAK